MNREGADGGNAEPWRFPRSRRGPRRDLGPAGSPVPSPSLHPLLTARLVQDAFTLDAVELASVRAEEAVQPFLASRPEPFFLGRSVVNLGFRDEGTLASFRRVRAVRSTTAAPGWRLLRRWAWASWDGGLDERMCRVVAWHLNRDFAGLLRAEVLTWLQSSRPFR